ncbi:MAG: hypothetical protein R3F02_16835 [Thiolinea sp.]
MLKKISTLIFILLLSPASWGFELTQVTGTQTEIAYAGTADKSAGGETYLIADHVIAPDEITGYIPFNKQVGILTFSVLSPQKSKIIMEWDNPNQLYSRIGKTLKFRRAGEYQSISFNATGLITGYISLYNDNRKLLKRVHYTIKKQRAYSQNLRAFVRDSQSDGSNNADNTTDQNVGLSYSISQRANIGDPRFYMGLSVSSDLNNTNNRSISASVGYSW